MKIQLLMLGFVSASLACAAVGVSSTAVPLERTRWALISLGPDEIPIPKSQTEAFIVLGGEPGRVIGSGGCNRLAGSYEQKGDALKFGPLASTRMACERGMETEDGFHQALTKTASFVISGDELELRNAEGALLATLQAHDGPS